MKSITVEVNGINHSLYVTTLEHAKRDYPSHIDLCNGMAIVGRFDKGHIVEMIGLKVFDYAIPQSAFDQMTAKGLNPHEYVWCYDDNKMFGAEVNVVATFIRMFKQPIMDALLGPEKGED